MQSKPVVYVSRITNLSDARYCAGMGVDLLGYVVDPSDPDYVSPEAYQQMVGWISGPGRVLELGEAVLRKDELKASYSPEFIHVHCSRVKDIPPDEWKLIVEVPLPDLDKIQKDLTSRKDIAYFLITSVDVNSPRQLQAAKPVLVGVQTLAGSARKLLDASGAGGIALQGSKEVTPGLKDYDHLSQVLEELNG